MAARAFAAALQCPEHGCGHCPTCRTIMAGTHPDVRQVVPEGLSIRVDEMRNLVQLAARRPATAPYQILVITDADRLTEGAANALLKAVEEPPERTVFLLCAPSDHQDDVPITIRSRCRVVPLRTPSPDAIAEVLIDRDGIDPDTARLGGGGLRRPRRAGPAPGPRPGGPGAPGDHPRAAAADARPRRRVRLRRRPGAHREGRGRHA